MMELSTLHSQIESALQTLLSPSSPEVIGQVQTSLLQWEEHRTDEYVVCLLSLIGCHTATIRLAAILSLKAGVMRRWKDRGRGKLVRKGETAQHLLSESVKHAVRQSMLSLVCAGFLHSFHDLSQMITCYTGNSPIEVKCITDVDTLSSSQAELIQDKQLQTNAAALIGKIGRLDLPLKFNELFPSLVSGIQCSREATLLHSNSHTACEMFQTVQFNIMSVLEALLDEMSTQRLLVDKKYRNEMCKLYLGTIVQFSLVPALESDFSNVNALKSAMSASRIVSFMMVSSFPKLIEEKSTAVVVEHTLQLFYKFLSSWLPHVLQEASATNNELTKLLCIQCNCIVELQSNHASTFFKYGDVFLRLFYESFSSIMGGINSKHVQKTLNELVTAFLLFMAKIVSSSAEYDAAAKIWETVFSPPAILSLTQQLLLLFSRHIYTSNSTENDNEDDREYWQENPEGFYQWEMQRSSEDDIGCASQNLFLALMESYRGREVILPWFVGLLENVSAQQVAINIEAADTANPGIVTLAMPLGNTNLSLDVEDEVIMQYDAIWTAVGLVGGLIEGDKFNYMSWFNAVLRPSLSLLLESKSVKRRLPVLRRRLIWLLPTNAHKVDVLSLHSPIDMLLSILTKNDHQNDVCVRLTAVQSLEVLLPCCEERRDILQSLVEPIVPAVYALTEHCSEVENRTTCLEFISTVILYVNVSGGELSNNILNAIASPLLMIWNNAIDQNLLLKRNVLSILSCLASYVGPDQVSILYPLALPMIDASFQGNGHLYLVEDALRIWYTFLRLSKSYASLLGKLFVHAAKLSKELEHVIALAKITERYIVIGQKDFLNEHAYTLQSMLNNLVGEVSPRGQAYVMLVTEALLRQFPSEGGQLLMQCEVIKRYLGACSLASSTPEESEPDRVIVLYLTTLARIYLDSPELLGNLELAGGLSVTELIALYVSKFNVAGNGASGLLFQQLWAMLLLSFYPPSTSSSWSPIVLSNSSEIFPLFAYVIKNVHLDRSNLLTYEVGYDDDDTEDTFGIPESELNIQVRQTNAAEDIIIRTNFLECVVLKISGLPAALGQESYQCFIANTSREALEELNDTIEKARLC